MQRIVEPVRLALVACCGLAACAGSSPAAPDNPDRPVVASVHIEQGDAQSAEVGNQLPEALVVQARDADDMPVPEAKLHFQVVQGVGLLTPAAAITDATGRATTRWRVSNVAGAQVLAIRIVAATGDTLTLATATATALAGPLTALVVMDTVVPYLDPGGTTALRVTGTDYYGNPTATAPLTWSSSDPAVLAVNDGGRISALAPGRAEVVVRVGAVATSRSFVVRPVVPVDHLIGTGIVALLAGSDRVLAKTGDGLLDWDGAVWRRPELPFTGFVGIGPAAIAPDGTVWVALTRENDVDYHLSRSSATGSAFVAVSSSGRSITSLAAATPDLVVAGSSRPVGLPDGSPPRPRLERLDAGAWTDLQLPFQWPGDSTLVGISVVADGNEVWLATTLAPPGTGSPRPLLLHHDETGWKEIALPPAPTPLASVQIARGVNGTLALLVRDALGSRPSLFRIEGQSAVPVPVNLLKTSPTQVAVSPTGRLGVLGWGGVAWESHNGWIEYPLSPGVYGAIDPYPPLIAWVSDSSLWVSVRSWDFLTSILKEFRIP